MSALISGFCNIGNNIVLKKKLEINKLLSIKEELGYLFVINLYIILQTHFKA